MYLLALGLRTTYVGPLTIYLQLQVPPSYLGWSRGTSILGEVRNV